MFIEKQRILQGWSYYADMKNIKSPERERS